MQKGGSMENTPLATLNVTERTRLRRLNKHFNLGIPDKELFFNKKVEELSLMAIQAIRMGKLNPYSLLMSTTSIKQMYSKSKGFTSYIHSNIPALNA